MLRLEQPVYKSIPETDALELCEQFFYDQNDITLTIPKGFVWDGASIPRAFWITTGSNYNPDFILPGLLHDYLYYTGLVSKKKADDIFLIELKRSGVGFYTRYKMYYAVRFFGHKAWEQHRKRDGKKV